MSQKYVRACGAIFFVTIFFGALFTPSAQAASSADLEAKIKKLEDRIDELEMNSSINSEESADIDRRLSELVSISGYADVELILSDRKEDTSRFRIHHFSLFIEKELNESWQIFSEIEFEDAPFIEADSSGALTDAEGKILVEQVYTDYSFSHHGALRMGRYLTPAGIWLVNHYPPFVPTQLRPKHIRRIFPQYLDGVQLFGDIALSDSLLTYALYVGNGEGNAGAGDGNDEKAVGGRIALMPYGLADVQVGLSTMTDTDNNDTRKTAYGVDLKGRLGGLRVQGEYAMATFDPSGLPSHERSGYYLQAQYDLGLFTLVGRYDTYDPNDSVSDDGVVVSTAAVNYHWSPTIVSKIEANSYDYETDSDYVEWIVSTALFF